MLVKTFVAVGSNVIVGLYQALTWVSVADCLKDRGGDSSVCAWGRRNPDPTPER